MKKKRLCLLSIFLLLTLVSAPAQGVKLYAYENYDLGIKFNVPEGWSNLDLTGIKDADLVFFAIINDMNPMEMILCTSSDAIFSFLGIARKPLPNESFSVLSEEAFASYIGEDPSKVSKETYSGNHFMRVDSQTPLFGTEATALFTIINGKMFAFFYMDNSNNFGAIPNQHLQDFYRIIHSIEPFDSGENRKNAATLDIWPPKKTTISDAVIYDAVGGHPISTIDKNTALEVVGVTYNDSKEKWYALKLPDGREGFARGFIFDSDTTSEPSSSYISFITPSPETSKVPMPSPTSQLTVYDRIYCKHCGQSIDADSLFCRFCGGSQTVDMEQTTFRNVDTWIEAFRCIWVSETPLRFFYPDSNDISDGEYISFVDAAIGENLIFLVSESKNDEHDLSISLVIHLDDISEADLNQADFDLSDWLYTTLIIERNDLSFDQIDEVYLEMVNLIEKSTSEKSDPPILSSITHDVSIDVGYALDSQKLWIRLQP